MTEPNYVLDALIDAAKLSHAGLAARLNEMGVNIGFSYDHASVARWIRDGTVPRNPAPDMICQILGSRLGRTLQLADVGMDPQVARRGSLTLNRVVEQAKALWRADGRDRAVFRVRYPVTGADAVLPLFEWENPPVDIDVSHQAGPRIGRNDVAQVLAARSHYEQMYRRVGGIPVRPRLVATLTTHIAPMLDGSYDDATGRLAISRHRWACRICGHLRL